MKNGEALMQTEEITTDKHGSTQMKKLPDGWEVKKLSDVCIIKPPKSEARTRIKSTDKVSFLPMEDLGICSKNINLKQIKKLSEVEGSYTYFAEDDVLLAKITPCFENGKLGIAKNLTNGIGFGSSEYIVFRPSSSIFNEYLFYFISQESFRHKGAARMTGAVGHKRVAKDFIESYNIPLPSLSEQKRIVAILDEAFAAIDKAKVNVEKNLANAKELFESYLNGIFTNPGEDWEEKKLGEVCDVERGSSPRPIKKYQTDSPDGVNWIKIGDTKGIDKYICTTKEKITKKGALKSRYVKEGDFILSNSMSFGKPYIMKTDGYIHDGWFVLRLHNYINTDFFYELLSSTYVQNQFTTLSSGAIVRNINSDLTKKAKLPIPKLQEQELILTKLESIKSETKRIEVLYQRKLSALDELKKSILKKAFEGEL